MAERKENEKGGARKQEKEKEKEKGGARKQEKEQGKGGAHAQEKDKGVKGGADAQQKPKLEKESDKNIEDGKKQIDKAEQMGGAAVEDVDVRIAEIKAAAQAQIEAAQAAQAVAQAALAEFELKERELKAALAAAEAGREAAEAGRDAAEAGMAANKKRIEEMKAGMTEALMKPFSSASSLSMRDIQDHRPESMQAGLSNTGFSHPGRLAFHLGFPKTLVHLKDNPSAKSVATALELISFLQARGHDQTGLCFDRSDRSDRSKSAEHEREQSLQFNQASGYLSEITWSSMIAHHLSRWAEKGLVIFHQCKDSTGCQNDVMGYLVKQGGEGGEAAASAGSGAVLRGLLPSFIIECGSDALTAKVTQLFAYAYNSYTLVTEITDREMHYNPCLLGLYLRYKDVNITEWSLVGYCMVTGGSTHSAARLTPKPLLLAEVPLSIGNKLALLPGSPITDQSEPVQSLARALSALELCVQNKGWAHSFRPVDMRVNVVIDDKDKVVFKVFDSTNGNARSLEWNMKYLPNAKIVYRLDDVAVLRYNYIPGNAHATSVSQVISVLGKLLELHIDGVCHGDIRGYNLVFGDPESGHESYLLDFDFSRKIPEPQSEPQSASSSRVRTRSMANPAELEYPTYPDGYVAVGLPDVKRHSGAVAGERLAFEHDVVAMQWILRQYECTGKKDTWEKALGDLFTEGGADRAGEGNEGAAAATGACVNTWSRMDSCNQLSRCIKELNSIKSATLEFGEKKERLLKEKTGTGSPPRDGRKLDIVPEDPTKVD